MTKPIEFFKPLEKQEVTDFLKRMAKSWQYVVTTKALRTLADKKYNKPVVLQ